MSINALITRVTITPSGTDARLIRAVERRFGPLDIDLAATAEDTKAPRYIGPDRDSLKCDWNTEIGVGLAWLNPPVGDMQPWSMRCAAAARDGRRILLLCQHATDSDWYWQDVLPYASIHVLVPRLVYEGVVMPLIVGAFNFGVKGAMYRWWWERELDV